MIRYLLLLLAPLSCGAGELQLYPTLGETRDISTAMQQQVAALAREIEERGEYSPAPGEAAAFDLLWGYGGCYGTGWAGCSWYCGGGPDNIHASAFLPATGAGCDYLPENIHDFALNHAWAVNGPEYSKGEYIEFTFENSSPRVTTVEIYSGYQKSDLLFKENSRPMRLRLHVNDVPYAVLNLQDTRALQSFAIGTQGHREDGEPLVLRFEVLEVYPGSKYQDLCISEINFDGIDVH